MDSFSLDIFIGIGLLTTIIHIVSYVSILAFTKSEGLDNSIVGAQSFVATFPNALIYPFPIILATVGEEGILYATVFVFFVLTRVV